MILGIDWGAKKIGLATADDSGIVVSPKKTITRARLNHVSEKWALRDEDSKLLENFLSEEGGAEEFSEFVLGCPKTQNTAGIEAEGAHQLAGQISGAFDKTVYLVDESLSSWESKGFTAGSDDAAAASVILKDFFEQRARSEKIPSMKTSKRGQGQLLFYIGAAVLSIIFVIGAYGYYDFNIKSAFKSEKGNESETLVVDVAPGTSLHKLRADLEAKGFQISKLSFQIWIRLRAATAKLRVGEYKVQKKWSAGQIFKEILSGQPLMYKFTIPEGTNSYEVQALLKNIWPDDKRFAALIESPKYLSEMEVPKWNVEGRPRRLEGFLFPETYSFQKYDTSDKLIKAMLEEFKTRALPILKEHPWGATPEGRYRLLTLASVIEKESGNKEEQPIIASVFWNRLEKKMKLQSDPTIIYGLLPFYDGNIRKIDLLTSTPWNTYTIGELPVSPITNPGESALRATVAPAKTSYLFFVSKNDGTHVFSEDYKSHALYVDEFQRKRKSPSASEGRVK